VSCHELADRAASVTTRRPACYTVLQKPQELGYAYELWTYGLLTQHIRQRCEAAGYPELRRLSRSKLHKILTKAKLRPHKIRYYVERRDPNFEGKMGAVLHVYKEVEIINQGLLRGALREVPLITISYDESRACKPWHRRAQTARLCPGGTPATRGTTNTSDWVRSRCWREWTCTPGE